MNKNLEKTDGGDEVASMPPATDGDVRKRRGRKRLPEDKRKSRVAFVLSKKEHDWATHQGNKMSDYITGLIMKDMKNGATGAYSPHAPRWRNIPESGERWHSTVFLTRDEWNWVRGHVSISGYVSGLVRKDMEISKGIILDEKRQLGNSPSK